MKTPRWLCILLPASLAAALTSFAADPPPKAPVPPSPYIPVIYKFADAMLSGGRDTHGTQKTGLFLSALDRSTVGPLTTRPPAPSGVREEDRAGFKDGPLTGCNLQHDQNLLRLLYTLSELSSKPFYRDAADGALKWFLQNPPAPDSGAYPWGRGLAWDAMKDEPTAKGPDTRAAYLRPWMLWDRCFDLAPESAKKLASGTVGLDSPTDVRAGVGYSARNLAVAYARTDDVTFLYQINSLLPPLSGVRRVHARESVTEPVTAPVAQLSLAIDCDGAAHRLPAFGAAQSQLPTIASRSDDLFCSLPHDLKNKGGFVSAVKADGTPVADAFTVPWQEKDGTRTTAAVALMCLSRYENTGKTAYRDLLVAAAEFYLKTPPPEDLDLWPLTLGHAISLQVAAWRHTSRQVHLDHARRLADMALEKFWGTSALPRASLKSEHYESITGAGTLALALVELHLNILHITAVRCPPNTIDR